MLELRVTAPSDLTEAVLERLQADPAVSALAVIRGASLKPRGDLVTAELPREAANEIIDYLRDLGVQDEGSIHLEPIRTWISRSGFAAERRTPGAAARTQSCGPT